MSILEVKNLSIKYNDFLAIDNANFSIPKNKFITIIGPNGGGKTTLIKAILGFITNFKGDITIDKNTQISYVPQKDNFEDSFPIKVKEVILSGILPKKIRLFHKFTKEDKLQLTTLLKQLNITKLKEKQINELSGGELQKVFLARSLISNPNLLILDEPFANIDTDSTNDYFNILKKLSKKMTVLLVSHDIGVISSYTDDVICVNKQVHYHNNNNLTNTLIQSTYGCPIDLIGHGIPHRVFPPHINKD